MTGAARASRPSRPGPSEAPWRGPCGAPPSRARGGRGGSRAARAGAARLRRPSGRPTSAREGAGASGSRLGLHRGGTTPGTGEPPPSTSGFAGLLDDLLAVLLGAGAGLDHGLGLGDLAGDAGLGVLLGAPLLPARSGLAAGLPGALPPARASGARPFAVPWSSPSLAGLLMGVGDRTSGSTCASRSGPACFAATCSSRSCGACTPRRRASRRFEHLRPCLLNFTSSLPSLARGRTEKTPGPRHEVGQE